jgi:hypothetical protein
MAGADRYLEIWHSLTPRAAREVNPHDAARVKSAVNYARLLITSKIVNMNTARTCLPKGSRTTTGGRGRVKAPEMQRLTKY